MLIKLSLLATGALALSSKYRSQVVQPIAPYILDARPENPIIRKPVVDTSGGNCRLNPFFYLTILDLLPESEYPDNLATNSAFDLGSTKGGRSRDAVYGALRGCQGNKGLEKLKAIKLISQQKPEILSDLGLVATNGLDSYAGGAYDLDTMKTLFSSNFDFFKSVYKYKLFTQLYSGPAMLKNNFDQFQKWNTYKSASTSGAYKWPEDKIEKFVQQMSLIQGIMDP